MVLRAAIIGADSMRSRITSKFDCTVQSGDNNLLKLAHMPIYMAKFFENMDNEYDYAAIWNNLHHCMRTLMIYIKH